MNSTGKMQKSASSGAMRLFKKFYKDSVPDVQASCPGSIILLGDHTHYNEGIILATTIENFVSVNLRKCNENKISMQSENDEINIKDFSGDISKHLVCCGVNYSALIHLLIAKHFINSGFECAVYSEIPLCIGIGRVTAHYVALLLAIKKAFNLEWTNENIIEICRDAELNYLGRISNKTHAFNILMNGTGKIFKLDLRTEKFEYLDWKSGNYKLVICNTNNKIENIRDICNERINECEVGVQGLRLYIWGIKNLRDVGQDFLDRHVKMIPNLVFKRVKYNVGERMRVESVLRAMKQKQIEKLGEAIFLSHNALRGEYEIGAESLDFIVDLSKETKGVVGAKMISCSNFDSVFAIISSDASKNYEKIIKENFAKRFNKKLEIFCSEFAGGVTCE